MIIRAGTTEEVGWRVQGGVMPKDQNDALRVALQTAVGPRAKRLEAKSRRAVKKPAAAKKPRRN